MDFKTIDEVLVHHDVTRMQLLRQMNNDGMSVGKWSLKGLAEQNKCPTKATPTLLKKSLMAVIGDDSPQMKKICDQIIKGGTNEMRIKQAVFGVIEVLDKYQVTQTMMQNALKEQGTALSATAISQILRHGIWPKSVAPELIVERTNQWAAQFAKPNEIKKMWLERSAPVNKQAGKTSQPQVVTTKPIIIFEQPEPQMLNQKTMRHFNLTRHPFENEIRAEADLFMSAPQVLLREAMVQASLGGSILAITGECGAGKTEVRKGYLEYIRRNHPEIQVCEPMVINKKRLTTEMIFDALAEELQIANMPSSLERRARKVEGVLRRSVKAGNRHVLIIEEAHDLTNDVVKYLKRIWELSDGFNRLISIILIGQPELEIKLAPSNYEVREFSRRCNVMKVYPLGNSITEYIAHKFQRCNVNYLNVIEPAAIAALQQRMQAKISYGMASKANEHQDMSYPLIVNNWLVIAMNLAAELGESKVSSEIIAEIK
ncbi:MAG: AAA family ATPase [Gammaproteobacteria bacterium]|nr:AAA family ATPase [Gammaproteobacteria bacterium]